MSLSDAWLHILHRWLEGFVTGGQVFLRMTNARCVDLNLAALIFHFLSQSGYCLGLLVANNINTIESVKNFFIFVFLCIVHHFGYHLSGVIHFSCLRQWVEKKCQNEKAKIILQVNN